MILTTSALPICPICYHQSCGGEEKKKKKKEKKKNHDVAFWFIQKLIR